MIDEKTVGAVVSDSSPAPMASSATTAVRPTASELRRKWFGETQAVKPQPLPNSWGEIQVRGVFAADAPEKLHCG